MKYSKTSVLEAFLLFLPVPLADWSQKSTRKTAEGHIYRALVLSAPFLSTLNLLLAACIKCVLLTLKCYAGGTECD